jgi:hypothetical protein
MADEHQRSKSRSAWISIRGKRVRTLEKEEEK